MRFNLLKIHLLSILTAAGLCIFLLYIGYLIRPDQIQFTRIIEGKQQVHRGVFANLSQDEQTELEFMASLKNPNQLTIMGSSEFSSSIYCPYHFLPDSMGLPTLGIGHAHHQSFSILCELLAAHNFLENANICVIISPSWFSTPGTNTEAFTEFVRPNFLKKIATDEQLDPKYKIAIGEFVYQHTDEFTSISNTLEYFLDLYQIDQSKGADFLKARLRQFLKQLHPSCFNIETVRYNPEIISPAQNAHPLLSNQRDYLKTLQEDFLSKITTNNMFVNDEYYNEYILSDSGTVRTDSISVIDFERCQELEDFKLLVSLLTEKKANCSFIIQPMNPYYYSHTERNKPLIDSLTQLLDQHQFPYLNMYAYDKESYEPATLKDVMHLGDFGWMKINFFLYSIYGQH